MHDAWDESYDDGDWVYLGDGVWEDAYIASLPADTRRDILLKYAEPSPGWSMRVRATTPEKSNMNRIGIGEITRRISGRRLPGTIYFTARPERVAAVSPLPPGA